MNPSTEIFSGAALITNAISAVKNARDLAKDVKGSELKDQISDVYDKLLDLKQIVLDQDEQIRQLKGQLADKAAYIVPVAPHGYFYAADDEQRTSPLCPVCFQDELKQVSYMSEPYGWNGGVRRECKGHTHIIYEKNMKL